jgi:hypothetical protein
MRVPCGAHAARRARIKGPRSPSGSESS